jgi:DNA polymerase/3'-5' exonuclease PolX
LKIPGALKESCLSATIYCIYPYYIVKMTDSNSSTSNSNATVYDCKGTIQDAFELLYKIEQSNKGVAAAAKRKAYKGALDKLAEISAITSEEDLLPFRGKAKDGGSIYQRALEILTTGTCAVLEEAYAAENKDVWAAYDIFMELHGVGPSMAYELASMGLRTIEDLKKAVADGTITLNRTQSIGLKYHDKITERIPREEMEEHEAILKKVAADAGCPQCDIVGSYRRGRPNSGDIDMLLCTKDSKMMDTMVEILTKGYYIREKLAHGAHKFMGICRLGKLPFRRLDILLTPPEEYGYALLHFTGSDKFNIKVRQHAITLGYSLNEHRLMAIDGHKPLHAVSPKGETTEHTLSIIPENSKSAKNASPKIRSKPVPDLRTEAEILAFLGIKFVEPKDRETIEALTLVA